MTALPTAVKLCEACGEPVCASRKACDDYLEHVEEQRREEEEQAAWDEAQDRKLEEHRDAVRGGEW